MHLLAHMYAHFSCTYT